MKIAVIRETAPGETRVAATPETIKKFTALGAELAVEKGAGEAASVADSNFEGAGATVDVREKVLAGADVILCINNLSRFPQPVELDLRRFQGMIPVELLGGVPFPPIGELPYLLTLGGYGFYWFRLTTSELPEEGQLL